MCGVLAFSLHVHQYGDHTLLSASSAGAHYNPNSYPHNLPYESTYQSTAYMLAVDFVIVVLRAVLLVCRICGSLLDTARHVGDLGNVQVAADGQIYFNAFFDVIQLGGNTWNNVIGRGVVLHSYPDQGVQAQSTGNAGWRMGMGVLGISNGPFPSIDTRKSSILAIAVFWLLCCSHHDCARCPVMIRLVY